MEGAKAFASKESARFLNIQKLLLENRVAVELALKRESRGQGPAPHQVMDRLLNIKSDQLGYKGTELQNLKAEADSLDCDDWVNTPFYHHIVNQT